MRGGERFDVWMWVSVVAVLASACATAPVAPAPSEVVAAVEEAPAEVSVERRAGVIHRDNAPLTLLGPALSVGDEAPSVPVRDNSMKEVEIDFKDVDGVRQQSLDVSYEVVDPANGDVVYDNYVRFENEAEQQFERVSTSDINENY